MDTETYSSLTYRQTSEYHDKLRLALYRAVEQEYVSLAISVREISASDIREAETWKKKWRKPGRAASWDWSRLYSQYHSSGGARRFDLAITKNNGLLGLSYGMLERNRLILKVHAMESNPTLKSIISGKMLQITLFAANVYADINQASEIWLCTPTSDAHVRLYQNKGYTPYYDYFDNCTHLIRKLSS